MRKIWVVEVDFRDGKGWQPTVGVALSRDKARKVFRLWRYRVGYGTRIRICCYVPKACWNYRGK